MGRGKSLTVEEKLKIKIYKESDLSINQIAKKIGRSRNVVSNFLKNESSYGKNMKGRTKSVLSAADKRAILRKASNSHDSAAQILAKTGVVASVRTVQRVISKADHLKRLKLKKKPPLNDTRKKARLEFCRSHWTGKTNWHRVVFSDEKKFNFEGPDGFNYYFHDIRKENHYLDRLHSRVGGVMVWGAISYYGTIDLQFLTTTMNANCYKNVLQEAFPQFKNFFGDLEWIFQHDNAPIHTAGVVKSWIRSQNVKLLNWPPYSPELNVIENVWGWLVRKVYASGKQYNNRDDLIYAIKEAWSTISLDYIKSLYDSIPDRMYEVVLNKGGPTHY